MLRLTSKIVFIVLLFILPLGIISAHGDETPVEPSNTNTTENETNNHDSDEAPMWSVVASLGLATVVVGGSQTITKNRFTKSQYSIIALMLISGGIHLVLGFEDDILLILNGLGYFGLVSLRFMPLFAKQPQAVLLDAIIIIYTAITIIGYFVSHSHLDTLGGITKAVEALLILMLLISIFQQPKQPIKVS